MFLNKKKKNLCRWIGTFVLRYIYQNPNAPPFIIKAQAQLFAIITKLGWLENEEFRALVDQLQVFFMVRHVSF